VEKLPFNLCIAFLAGILMNFVTPAFSSPTPTPTAIIIPTPTATATTTVSATPTPQPPTVTTGEATVDYGGENGCLATLSGTVNANGLQTTAWFEYGETSGSYSTTATQTISGTSNTEISNEIEVSSTLDCNIETYYYRLVAQNSAGKSYGSENTFASCFLYLDCFGCTVSGYITDSKTGKGISNATILIVNNGDNVVADTDGYYEYLYGSDYYGNVCGEVEITASAYGYVSSTKSGTSGQSEECSCSTTLNIELEPITSPSVSTGTATDIKSNSATLNGIVNANNVSSDVWFEYNKDSGFYSNTSSITNVSGSDNLEVRVGISGLSANTTYYHRVVAQNSAGTSYGSERSFTTSVLPEGTISGYVSDTTGNPIESVKVTLDGKKTFISITTFSDSDGFFAFYDLDADAYIIKASKKGYKRYKKTVALEEGESKEINIKIKKLKKARW